MTYYISVIHIVPGRIRNGFCLFHVQKGSEKAWDTQSSN